MYSLPFYIAHDAEYTALLWQRVQRETQEFGFLRIQTLLPSFGCNSQESQLPNTESCWGTDSSFPFGESPHGNKQDRVN